MVAPLSAALLSLRLMSALHLSYALTSLRCCLFVDLSKLPGITLCLWPATDMSGTSEIVFTTTLWLSDETSFKLSAVIVTVEAEVYSIFKFLASILAELIPGKFLINSRKMSDRYTKKFLVQLYSPICHRYLLTGKLEHHLQHVTSLVLPKEHPLSVWEYCE